jgi:hypothetical protein
LQNYYPLHNDWQGYSTESAWAEQVEDSLYRVRNVPFYAKGISIEDIVNMKAKKHINKCIEFKVMGRKETIKGILLDYSNDWTFLANNPVDFVLDGFVLVRNARITKYRVQSSASVESKILALKMKKRKVPKVELDTTIGLIKSLSAKNRVFSVHNKGKESFVIGKVLKLAEDSFGLRLLNTKAIWSGTTFFKISDFDLIEFDSDYINSLVLLAGA